MAHFRAVGGLSTLKNGETAYWATTYGDVYKVAIKNAGTLVMSSNLNIEDWQ